VRAARAPIASEHSPAGLSRIARATALACALASGVGATQAGATEYFRSASTAQTGSGATSIAINAPAGLVSGDVMLATVDAEGNSTITPPTGWSSTNLYSGSSNVGFKVVDFKVAGASEPSSFTWSLGTSRKAVGRILDYVGVENASPIEVKSGTAQAASGLSDSANQITTSVANTMVIVDFAGLNALGSFTVTPPAGTNLRASVFTSGSGSVVGADAQDFVQVKAEKIPTETFKPSVSIPWSIVTSALKPGTGALGFDVAPSTPSLPPLTLNGAAQTTHATMNEMAVDDTTAGTGWNITVAGNTAGGKSAVFKQYCPNATCGSDTGPGYVSGGATLAAGSLTLNSSGASWSTTGGAGSAPAFQCSVSACAVDASSATKIVSTASGAGLGPWKTSGFTSTSLALATPSTLRKLQENEVYRVDLSWTLSSGP
jgi:hypothetical protein